MAIVIALGVRTLVISSSPTFLLGGDTPGYVAYAREISQNGFLIPGLNTIHFPGSFWVYPPLLPYFWGVIIHFLGNQPLTPFYVIEISGMAIDSLVVVPVYKTAKTLFGKPTGVISAFLFAVYLPDLFALTWGGVPQLFATFLFAWVIYFTVLISREENRSYRNTLILAFLLIVLTFTHDLTIFVMLFSLLSILIVSLFLKKVRVGAIEPNMAHLNSIIRKVPVALLISMPALLFWYIPRYWWIIDAGAPYINANLPSVFTQTSSSSQLIYQGLNGFLSPLGFAIFLLPLAVWSMYLCFKHMPEKTGVILIFALLPLFVSIADYHDPIIVARMGYYTFLPSLMISSYGLVHFWKLYSGKNIAEIKRRISPIRRQKVAAAAILVPFLMVSTMGVSASMNSHTFYNSYLDSSPNQVIDYSTLNWIHSNVPKNSTFASFGEFGYYIMGYDGNPTLVYQSLKYLTQPAEWNESIAAYSLVFIPTHNISLTEHLIAKYHVDYVTTASNTTVPAFYKAVYNDNNTTIYYVG